MCTVLWLQGARYRENPYPRTATEGNPVAGSILSLDVIDMRDRDLGGLNLDQPFTFFIPCDFAANRIAAERKNVSTLSSVAIDMRMPLGVTAIRIQIFVHQLSLSSTSSLTPFLFIPRK